MTYNVNPPGYGKCMHSIIMMYITARLQKDFRVNCRAVTSSLTFPPLALLFTLLMPLRFLYLFTTVLQGLAAFGTFLVEAMYTLLCIMTSEPLAAGSGRTFAHPPWVPGAFDLGRSLTAPICYNWLPVTCSL